MEILTSILRILSWVPFFLGVYFDLFSLYCIVRVAINPCFRTSSVPFVGMLLYLMADRLGFPYKSVLLAFFGLDILMTLLCFIVGILNRRKRKDD